MPNCRVYPPEYTELVGCDVERGSIVAVAFIEETNSFTDISNPDEWVNGSNIYIHRQVRGLYQKYTSIGVEGKGRQDIRITGRKHAAIFKIDNIRSNEPYWNTLNKATNYKFAFVTSADYDTIFYVNKNVSIDAGLDVKRKLDSQLEWMITVKWSDRVIPIASDAPQGIFDGVYSPVPPVPGTGIFDLTFDLTFE